MSQQDIHRELKRPTVLTYAEDNSTSVLSMMEAETARKDDGEVLTLGVCSTETLA